MTDAPLDLLTVPADRCLVCGVAGERPGEACPRCGATDGDVRVLLRTGARAYADARTNALAGRFTDARGNLRLATSLGLAGTDICRELSGLIEAADPAVTAESARDYEAARSHAITGKFTAGGLLSQPDTPATRELRRLCAAGYSLRRKATWITASRYAAVGTTCAILAFWLPLRPVPEQPGLPVLNAGRGGGGGNENRSDTAAVTETGTRSGSPPTPGTQRPAPPPYPYPERLARRYYNDARSAYRTKQYRVAASLADLASETGKNTYLLPHALLLRAQIADITGDINASRFWARIATDSPTSSYAPLGLLRAAERSGKISGKQRDTTSYLQELIKRYPLSNEARAARGQYYPALLSGTIKEEALR